MISTSRLTHGKERGWHDTWLGPHRVHVAAPFFSGARLAAMPFDGGGRDALQVPRPLPLYLRSCPAAPNRLARTYDPWALTIRPAATGHGVRSTTSSSNDNRTPSLIVDTLPFFSFFHVTTSYEKTRRRPLTWWYFFFPFHIIEYQLNIRS